MISRTDGLSLVYCTALLILPGCTAYRTELLVHKISSPYPELVEHARNLAQQESNLSQPVITIWIHGTRFFSASIFKRIFQRQPALKPYTIVDDSHKLGQAVHALHHTYYNNNTPGAMLLFGWSGNLSFSAREHASIALCRDLEQIIHSYTHKYNKTPYIRIITHSHGGNVALNLAHIAQQRSIDWHIDELILLACPVQGKTMHCVHSKLFKHIYSFSSSTDLIQLLDPQWIFDRHNASAFFSKRDFPLSTKVTQVRINLNGRGLMHRDFSKAYVLRLLPFIINEVKQWEHTQPTGLSQWWYPAKKMLYIYTNGRHVNPQRYYYSNEKKLRKLARRVPISALNIHSVKA